MSRIIRRSGARDLPPSADRVCSAVIVESRHPKLGEMLNIASPAGVLLRVKVTEITPDAGGWIGWGEVQPGMRSCSERREFLASVTRISCGYLTGRL